MKLKLKKGAKVSFVIIILIILLVIYLIVKFVIYNSYNKNFKYITDLYKDSKILEKLDLDSVFVSQFIFLNDTYRIGIEYNSITKLDNNTYEVTDLNNDIFSFNYSISDSKEDYKKYFQAVNTVKNLKDDKLKIYSSIFKLSRDNKTLKIFKNNIPVSGEIALIDGDAFNGYLYKTNDTYFVKLLGMNKEFSFKFTGSAVNTEDIRVMLSTLKKE